MHSGGMLAGWKFSNFKDGVFSEFFHVNDADGNLALLPPNISTVDACMLSDMVSTGFHGQTGSLNIWELTEGYICCSMQTDFATSILTIANTVDPEYLIVEPTGVEMLSKIIENIQKIEYERITLLEPITILDGTMYERCMEEFSEICKD